MSTELFRSWSIDVAKQNDVSIEDLLNAIHIFHEVIYEEYPQDHPSIELHADGSGCVINLRDQFYKNLGPMYTFSSLKQLVDKSKELMKKYDIKATQ